MAVTVTTSYANAAIASVPVGTGTSAPNWTSPELARVPDSSGSRANIFATSPDTYEVHIARLVKAGAIVGNNIATNQQLNGSGGTQSLGGASNLWGNSLTVDDLNDPNFGVVIALGIYSNSGSVNTLASQYLQLQGFTFNIPLGATILGVEALLTYITVNAGGGTSVIYVDAVQLRVTFSWNPQVRANGIAGGTAYSPQQLTVKKDKTFSYDVFDKNHNFVGRWKDVATEPQIKRQVNYGNVTLDVELARNELSLATSSDNLTLENGELLTTESDEPLLIDLSAGTGLGVGTDADINYEIEVRSYFGDYGELLTENGEPLLTESSDTILVEQGAPSGRMLFQGYIEEFSDDFGVDDDIVLSCISHSDELANIMLESYDTVYESVSGSGAGSAGISGSGPNDASVLYQTFTPATTHLVRRYGLTLKQGFVGAGIQATLRLFAGVPGGLSTILAAQTIELQQDVTKEYIFDFGIDVGLLADNNYYLELSSNTQKTGGAATYPFYWVAAFGSGAKILYNSSASVVDFSGSAFNYNAYYGGGSTTVTYSNMSPSQMLKLAIDFARARGSRINYSSASIEPTNTIATVQVKGNDVMQFVDAVLKACPADWFWYVNPATNEMNLHPRPSNVSRYYVIGSSINKLRVRRSLRYTANDVYFTGGAPDAYIRRQDQLAITQWRRKLLKMSDSRVIDAATANIFAYSEINRRKSPPYILTGTVLATADEAIEDVQLGELVAFGNTGSYIDNLQVMISSIDYSSDSLDLMMGNLPPREPQRLELLRRRIDAIEQANNPSIPS